MDIAFISKDCTPFAGRCVASGLLTVGMDIFHRLKVTALEDMNIVYP